MFAVMKLRKLRDDTQARRDDEIVFRQKATARIAHVVQRHGVAEPPVVRVAQREGVLGFLDDVLSRVNVVDHRYAEFYLPRPALWERLRVRDDQINGKLPHFVAVWKEKDAEVVTERCRKSRRMDFMICVFLFVRKNPLGGNAPFETALPGLLESILRLCDKFFVQQRMQRFAASRQMDDAKRAMQRYAQQIGSDVADEVIVEQAKR